MKRHTTYPTTHPHWIDSDDDSEPRSWRLGISFKTAFAIVLALHVAAVGGIYAYSSASPRKSAAAAVKQEEPAAEAGPKSDALVRNDWPEPEAKPQVVATPAPVKKEVAKSTPASAPKKADSVAASKVKEAPTQPKTPQLAKTTPKTQPKADKPVQSTSEDEMKKAFLATRETSTPDVEIREAIPVAAQSSAVVASNAEVSAAPALPAQPIAKNSTPVASKVAAAPTTPRPARYTLAPGDNLYMVSRRLQVSYNDLMQANNLTDPRQLRVGQTLVVPES